MGGLVEREGRRKRRTKGEGKHRKMMREGERDGRRGREEKKEAEGRKKRGGKGEKEKSGWEKLR